MLTVLQVKRNPHPHDCQSAKRVGVCVGITQEWVCSKVVDWLKEDGNIRIKELIRRLKNEYKVNVPYRRVYKGKNLAMDQIYGPWDKSFDNLFRFKAQIEESSPGSFVIIDHHTINNKIRFNRLFFALKACVDGFLRGCRPYLAVDSTFLNGRFRGQLCVACAVDGHNWMYPVAVGVIDSETNENWVWFMERLKEVIGSPDGLTFCTDCGQAVMNGVTEVFPEAEHRECMYHLVQNFKKRFSGKVFDDHLWAASYSWSPYLFNKHYTAMAQAKPEAMVYLHENHKKLWTRSQYRTGSKVDYVTNNLAESFNNWIKPEKGKNIDDLLDTIRQKLLIKWNHRKRVAMKFTGKILPHIERKLREDSYNLDIEVITDSPDGVAEICAKGGSVYRFVVNLPERTCTCRVWQGSGIPCKHAIAYITSIPGAKLEDYVHDYYSVDKFKIAYEGSIPCIPDKSMWPNSTHGFFMHTPLLRATAGGRRKNRMKSALEGGSSSQKGSSRSHECPICHEKGHHWYTCKNGNPEDIAAMEAQRYNNLTEISVHSHCFATYIDLSYAGVSQRKD